MSPALRSDGKGHLSRRITLMVLPFAHGSEPDATSDSSSEFDSQFHSEICLEPGLSRVANTPIAELPSDSSSIKKSSA
jgi:hypothetical protein